GRGVFHGALDLQRASGVLDARASAAPAPTAPGLTTSIAPPASSMTIERGVVPGLAEPPGYMHYAAVTDARLVFLAGQVPLDERGEIVGRGDPIEQTRRCLTNLEQALAAVGATPGDAVRTTVYVVASDQRHMGDV